MKTWVKTLNENLSENLSENPVSLFRGAALVPCARKKSTEFPPGFHSGFRGGCSDWFHQLRLFVFLPVVTGEGQAGGEGGGGRG